MVYSKKEFRRGDQNIYLFFLLFILNLLFVILELQKKFKKIRKKIIFVKKIQFKKII